MHPFARLLLFATLLTGCWTGSVAAQSAPPICAPFNSQLPALDATGDFSGQYAAWKNLPATGFAQIALVIGNDYTSNAGTFGVPALNNPHNDATTIANVLAARGYRVVCLFDVGKADSISAVQHFRVAWDQIGQTQAQGIGFIYFAGHGGETADGEPFILPADFDRVPAGGSGMQILPLYQFTAFVPEQEGSPIVVVIDACRSVVGNSSLNDDQKARPFDGSLPAIEKQEQIPILHFVFSTSNGAVADDGPANGNGPFADSMQKFLDQPPWSDPKAPWTLPSDPVISDIVSQISGALQNQIPVELSAQSDDLWVLPKSSDEKYFLWHFGRFFSHVVNVDDPCGQLDHAEEELTKSIPQVGWMLDAHKQYAEQEEKRSCSNASALAAKYINPTQVAAAPISAPPGPPPQSLPPETSLHAAGISAAVMLARPASPAGIAAGIPFWDNLHGARGLAAFEPKAYGPPLETARLLSAAHASVVVAAAARIAPQPKPSPPATEVAIAIDGGSGAVSEGAYEKLTGAINKFIATKAHVDQVYIHVVEPLAASSIRQAATDNDAVLTQTGKLRSLVANLLDLDRSRVLIDEHLPGSSSDQVTCLTQNVQGICLLFGFVPSSNLEAP